MPAGMIERAKNGAPPLTVSAARVLRVEGVRDGRTSTYADRFEPFQVV